MNEEESMNEETEKLVAARNKTHGNWVDNARASVRLKMMIQHEIVMRARRGQDPLEEGHVEALHMICAKIGRILAGDPNYQDHWDDIAGYARIANKEL